MLIKTNLVSDMHLAELVALHIPCACTCSGFRRKTRTVQFNIDLSCLYAEQAT